MQVTIPTDAHRTGGDCENVTDERRCRLGDGCMCSPGIEPVSYWWVVDGETLDGHGSCDVCGNVLVVRKMADERWLCTYCVQAMPSFRYARKPPADLAALTEPCTTCPIEQRGSVLVRDLPSGRQRWEPCPDCVVGRPLVEAEIVKPPISPTGEDFDGHPVSLGVGTLELIPVAGRDDRSPTALVFTNEVGNTYVYWPDRNINIPVDVSVEPGQFVACWTEVPQ